MRRRRDYQRIQRQGARGSSAHLQVVLRQARGPGRFGLTVSKKVGKAVARNRLKRRLREILRREKELFARREVVVIAREGAAELGFLELAAELREAIEKASSRPAPRGQPRRGQRKQKKR